MKYKAVIFDLDDTLLDWNAAQIRVEEEARHFDEVVGRIQAKKLAIRTTPELGICEECDLRTLCPADGLVKGGE